MLLGAISLGTAFAPEYNTFNGLRFVVAAAATGLYMCCFVIGTVCDIHGQCFCY